MKRIAGYVVITSLALLGSGAAVHAQQDATIYDEGVKLVSFEELEYPLLAKRTGIQGSVVIKVGLSEGGDVVDALALSGSRLLVPEALANARKWKFKPNVHHGAIIVYVFRLEPSGCRDDSGSLFLHVHPNLATITACTHLVEMERLRDPTKR